MTGLRRSFTPAGEQHAVELQILGAELGDAQPSSPSPYQRPRRITLVNWWPAVSRRAASSRQDCTRAPLRSMARGRRVCDNQRIKGGGGNKTG